jgi:histidinol-phosphate aminotransferase
MKNNPYYAASNENLFGSSPQVRTALQQALAQVSSYPQPDAADLRVVLAERLGIHPDELIIGSGSAELISLLVRRFCGYTGTGEILALSPSYPLYRQEAYALQVPFKAVPLTSSYQVDRQALLRQVNDATRLLFLCNPNNPTGTYLSQNELAQLLGELPAHVTMVVDEAYIEYATAPDCANALSMLPSFPNLVVLRTFSKAYGLASVRVGYMIAQRQLITQVLEAKQPYNVNHLAQVAAMAALGDEQFLAHTLKATQAGKADLAARLQQLGVHYWPSQGNFLLLDAGIGAEKVYDYLLANNITVRRTDDNYTLRLTIGPEEHQLYLLSMLQALLHPDNLYPQQPLLAQVLQTGYSLSSLTADAMQQAIEDLSAKAAAQPDAEGRIALSFARAFAARSLQNTANAGNLYASSFGVMDMISAFNVLVTATPLVTFGHLFANHNILTAIAGKTDVYLLDLGIGSGLQWFRLMELLAALPGEKPVLHLTGIDLSDSTSPDPLQKLKETGERLSLHAQQLGLAFSYTCIGTRLEDFDLTSLSISPSQTLVVNAALTLHHLADELVSQPDQRDRVLQQIRTLQPAVLTLTEPDSEHNRLDFLPRLRESLRHYHTVFDVLDALLPPDMPERQIIEQEFFGREIMNVIACEGSARVERHERDEAWQRRLIRNGFKPAPQQDIGLELAQELALHPSFSLVPNGAGYTLHWKGENIISSTAWITA